MAPAITAPNPRVVPEPIKIEQPTVAKPVPKFINKTTLEDVERASKERRQRIEEEVRGLRVYC